MSKDRQIARGLLGSIMLAGANIGSAFVQFRLVVVHLAPAAAGLWMLFLTMVGYLVLFDLGFSPTLGREVSFAMGNRALSREERDLRISRIVHSCVVAFVIISVPVILIGSFVGFEYLKSVSPPALLTQVRWAWVVLVVGAAFNLVGEVWFAALYGMGRVGTEKVVRCVGQVIWLVFTATALYLNLGLIGLSGAWLVQGILVRLLALYFFRKEGIRPSQPVSFDPVLVRSLAGPSLKYAATLLGGILILQTDNLVIASVIGTSQIPGYQAVSKLVTTLMSLSMMLVVTTTPFLSQAHAQDRVDEIKRLLYRNLRVSLSVLVVLGAFIAAFADKIIAIWLGPHQFVGFGVVWILLAVMLLEAHHVSMATATMATGRIVFVIPAIGAGVLNIGASIVLARHIGLFGVALGTLFAQVLTNNWYVPYYTMRQFGISLREHAFAVLFPIFRLMLAIAATAAVCRLAMSNWKDLQTLIVAAPIIGIIGTSAGFSLVLSQSERKVLSVLLRNRLKGVEAS